MGYHKEPGGMQRANVLRLGELFTCTRLDLGDHQPRL